MTSQRARAALGALGSVGLLAIGAASPAVAVPAVVEGCGAVPVGGDLTRTGDICQLVFSTPGDFSWTIPSGLEAIHSVVTGAGGGARVANGNTGYAGSGGDVKYLDLTNEAPGVVVQGSVGAGGVSGTTPTGGESSSVEAEFALAGADGGVEGDGMSQYCSPNGSYSVYVGNGNGAGGGTDGDQGDCATSTGPGIVPSRDSDVNDNSPLSLFADFDVELGAGGRVIVPAIVPTSASLVSGTGKGADVEYVDPEVPSWDATGDDGSVIIRYSLPAAAPAPEVDAETESAPELAETGAAEVAPFAALAALLLAGGATALAVSRRRTTN